MELNDLKFDEKSQRIKTLTNALGDSIDEKDFFLIIKFIEKIPLLRLIKTWETIEDLKKVTASNRTEILRSTREFIRRNSKL